MPAGYAASCARLLQKVLKAPESDAQGHPMTKVRHTPSNQLARRHERNNPNPYGIRVLVNTRIAGGQSRTMLGSQELVIATSLEASRGYKRRLIRLVKACGITKGRRDATLD